MKPRITKKQFRECINPDGSKTQVLDIIFKQEDKRLQVFIKDIVELNNKKYITKLIESARLEAIKYFDNLNINIASQETVEQFLSQDKIIN